MKRSCRLVALALMGLALASVQAQVATKPPGTRPLRPLSASTQVRWPCGEQRLRSRSRSAAPTVFPRPEDLETRRKSREFDHYAVKTACMIG
jgi:hypothetical protein